MDFLKTFNLTDAQTDTLFVVTQWCDQIWAEKQFGYAKDTPGTGDLSSRFADPKYRALLRTTLEGSDGAAEILSSVFD